jgi:hypothetical protein
MNGAGKGKRFTVVENSGFEDERDIRTFKTYDAAVRWATRYYDVGESERLNVHIARDTASGRTYDF